MTISDPFWNHSVSIRFCGEWWNSKTADLDRLALVRTADEQFELRAYVHCEGKNPRMEQYAIAYDWVIGFFSRYVEDISVPVCSCVPDPPEGIMLILEINCGLHHARYTFPWGTLTPWSPLTNIVDKLMDLYLAFKGSYMNMRLVFESRTVGAKFIPGATELYEQMNVGDELSLKPEPDNPTDANAILVVRDGQPVGYVPKAINRSVLIAMNTACRTLCRIVGLGRHMGSPSAEIQVFVQPNDGLGLVESRHDADRAADSIVNHLQTAREIIKDECCGVCQPHCPSCMGCAYTDCSPDTVGGMLLQSLAMMDSMASSTKGLTSAANEEAAHRSGAWRRVKEKLGVDLRKTLNFIRISRALSEWGPAGKLQEAAWYTVLPLKGKFLSKGRYHDGPPLKRYSDTEHMNNAFRAVVLPDEATGFAVFTGRTLTNICLCGDHGRAAWQLRHVPPFAHHPGKLKLTEEIAIDLVERYLQGVQMFGVRPNYAYFGHQKGIEALIECFLGDDGGLVYAHFECNSRDGFVSRRLSNEMYWMLEALETCVE